MAAGLLTGPAPAPAPARAQVAAAKLLAQEPDLGVTVCPGAAGSFPRCRRIGLAVWLREPARSVGATVAGYHVRLTAAAATQYDSAAARARRMFVGYLRAPRVLRRVRCFAGPPSTCTGAGSTTALPTVLVGIRVTTARSTARTSLYIQLAPGWS